MSSSAEYEWTAAEGEFCKYLRREGFEYIQRPDWIAKSPEGDWYSFEIKAKERFQPPPFEGHGLNERQFNSRMKLYADRNVIPVLAVKDSTSGLWMARQMAALNMGDNYLTRNKVLIFPVAEFKKLEGL